MEPTQKIKILILVCCEAAELSAQTTAQYIRYTHYTPRRTSLSYAIRFHNSIHRVHGSERVCYVGEGMWDLDERGRGPVRRARWVLWRGGGKSKWDQPRTRGYSCKREYVCNDLVT